MPKKKIDDYIKRKIKDHEDESKVKEMAFATVSKFSKKDEGPKYSMTSEAMDVESGEEE